MSPYLWIALTGLMMFVVGAFGHLWTTRFIETFTQIEYRIVYEDGRTGVRTEYADPRRLWDRLRLESK